MNDVFKTIYDRRAVRKYKNKAVDKTVVEQLIDAGRMAPSAMNRQPWKFYIVTNSEDINLYSKEITEAALKTLPDTGVHDLSHGIEFFKTSDPVFHGAPVVIFITAVKGNEWAPIDIGMCAQTIFLAAKSLGLDSCPVGFGKFIEQTPHYKKLGIPADEEVVLSIVIGYGNEEPATHGRIRTNAFYC